MKFFSHLNTSGHILGLYKGEQPFAIFLKQFFSQHKKYGSKDRKQISQLCYCYFRLGKALLSLPVEERLLTALFLCSNQSNELLLAVRPEWNAKVSLSLAEKCKALNIDSSAMDVFPWQDEISAGIDQEKFNLSFFEQPDLFIRIRPGYEKRVADKLRAAGIVFQSFGPSCIALPNGLKIEAIIELNREAVIQDRSSQAIGDFFDNLKPNTQDSSFLVWDCCAASGGKSIMAKDRLGTIDLTVSDIRESILINLRKRFQEAGITKYKSMLTDLSQSNSLPVKPRFDLVIADVPCTGSGTWGRTPEQLFYFDKKSIDIYAARQRNIISNTITALKPGGWLLYITCSVFRKENEELVAFIKNNHGLQSIKTEVIKGYDHKADSMFAALLQQRL